jgi:hypothetical protein
MGASFPSEDWQQRVSNRGGCRCAAPPQRAEPRFQRLMPRNVTQWHALSMKINKISQIMLYDNYGFILRSPAILRERRLVLSAIAYVN